MDSILRATVTYFFVWLIFRIAGKRTLADTSRFDLVLLLIISESLQAALEPQGQSLIHSFLIVMTLVGLDRLLSFLGSRYTGFSPNKNSRPILIVADGKLQKRDLGWPSIDEDDILASARESHGLERLDQIKFAILECHGGISVVPKEALQRKS